MKHTLLSIFCLSCILKIKQEEALLPKQLCKATCTGNFHQGRTTVTGSISNPLPQAQILQLPAQPLCGSFRLSTGLELGLKILSPSKRDGAPYCQGLDFPRAFYVTPFPAGVALLHKHLGADVFWFGLCSGCVRTFLPALQLPLALLYHFPVTVAATCAPCQAAGAFLWPYLCCCSLSVFLSAPL